MLDHIGNRQRLCVRRVCARIITRITTAPSCSTRTAITSKRSATFPRSSAQQHGARAPRPRPPARASGMQYQLLRAPVQQLGHIELILGRARHLVNPAEML